MIVGRILIHDLAIDSHIGVTEAERFQIQRLIISLTLDVDITMASKSDNINDTVNYKAIYDEVILLVNNSKFHLLERLAGEITAKCLSFKGVQRVTVKITKPNRLKNTNGVSIELTSSNEK